jgi:iron(III) transport system substrate-binding protein
MEIEQHVSQTPKSPGSSGKRWRSMHLRRIAMLAVAITVAACSGTPDTDEPGGRRGADQVVIMCIVDQVWCQVAVDAFTAQTGVDASFVRLSAGEGLARIRAEAGDPSFDVWFGGPSFFPVAAAANGLIEPYVSPNAAVIPAEFKDSSGIWTGVYQGVIGFCSNREVLAELGADVPSSWDDLLDPVFVRNIAIADQRTSGTAVTAAAALVALLGSENAALDYFRQLDPNVLQYTRSGSAPGRMAASGEIATAVIFAHDCVSIGLETGVDLAVTFPSEGTGFEIGQVSILAGAAHPDAARMFVDWSLTAGAQELAATARAFQNPTHPDAAVPAESVELASVLIVPGYTRELAERLQGGHFADRFGAEIRNGISAPAA